MGHSWSVLVSRSSVPCRREAILPSPMRRRMARSSQLQLDISIVFMLVSVPELVESNSLRG